jgi:hypothetical protein
MSVDYYLARAADARADADAAILANVREQCLRCEAVWNDMAARVAETEAMRRRNKAPLGAKSVDPTRLTSHSHLRETF